MMCLYICGRRRAWNIKIHKQSVKRLQNISIFNLSILKYHGCFKINPFPAIYNRFFLGKLSAPQSSVPLQKSKTSHNTIVYIIVRILELTKSIEVMNCQIEFRNTIRIYIDNVGLGYLITNLFKLDAQLLSKIFSKTTRPNSSY